MTPACVYLVLIVIGGVAGVDGNECNENCEARCAGIEAECDSARANLTGGPAGLTCDDLQTVPDTCKVLQDIKACLKEKLSGECLSYSGYNTTMQRIKRQSHVACSITAVCDQQFEKCLCHLSQPNQPHPCKDFLKAVKCVDNLPKKCSTDSAVNVKARQLQGLSFFMNYTHCHPRGGVCPDTVRCLQKWSEVRSRVPDQSTDPRSTTVPITTPETTSPPSNTTPATVTIQPPVHETDFCSVISMLDCLGHASTTCEIDQGTMTFPDIKKVMQDLCTGVIPDPDILSECPEFEACQKNAVTQLTLDFVDLNQMDYETLRTLAYNMASLIRTGYWCNLLEFGFKCALDNAEICGLESNYSTVVRPRYEELREKCIGAATASPLSGNSGTDPVATTTTVYVDGGDSGGGDVIFGPVELLLLTLLLNTVAILLP